MLENLLSGAVSSIGIGALAALLPFILGLILPRKKTIGYGIFVYNWIGKILLQTGNKVSSGRAAANAILAVRTTFVDFAYGIYLGSKNLSKSDRIVMVETHIKET